MEEAWELAALKEGECKVMRFIVAFLIFFIGGAFVSAFIDVAMGNVTEEASGWSVFTGLGVSTLLAFWYLKWRTKVRNEKKNKSSFNVGLSEVEASAQFPLTETKPQHGNSFFEKIFGPSKKTQWLQLKEREKQEKELTTRQVELESLKSLASQHEQALLKNWSNTVTSDEYGKKNYSSWNREVARFFGSTDFRPETLTVEEATEALTQFIEVQAVPSEPEKEQSLEEKAEQLKLLGVIEKHKNALIRNWHKLVEIDDYGSKNLHSWHEEIYKFFDSVNFRPKAMDVDYAAVLASYLVEDMVSENPTKSVFDYDEVKSAYDFEEKCAEELSLGGWKTQLTSGSGDQGIDVVAEKENVRVVIQCKLYSKPVGNKAVQEALSGMAFEKADYAAVVAPNGYTKSAIELANRTGVFLLSQNDLKVLSRYIEK